MTTKPKQHECACGAPAKFRLMVTDLAGNLLDSEEVCEPCLAVVERVTGLQSGQVQARRKR